MARAEATPESPFVGCCQVVSMSARKDDYLDEEGQAFIEFEEKGRVRSTAAA